MKINAPQLPNNDVETEKEQMASASSITQAAFYIIMVIFGILGNSIVIGVVGESVIREGSRAAASDVILVNLALSNLLVSLLRNILLMLTDIGLELFISQDWCRLFMCVWVWLRSVNVWSTFYLSAFHYHTLHRASPAKEQGQGLHRTVRMGLGLVWALNLLYSLPAYIYSKSGGKNRTETLMLVSTTTRPLLGCVWNFSSSASGLAYATSSLVVHEMLPIVLMSITNLRSLHTLYGHGQIHSSTTMMQDKQITRRIPAERRAAKVILSLILLFIISWGLSIISINLFNFGGSSVEALLIMARFSNSTFIALSPVVLAFGHRRLRSVMKSIVSY